MVFSTQSSKSRPDKADSPPTLAIVVACSLFAALLMLSGCTGASSEAHISEAVFDPDTRMLEANLDIKLSAIALDALDHGIPIVLEFDIRPDQGRPQPVRWQLSYLPLMRRYQLLIEDSQPRFFSSRVQLLAALDRFRVQLNSDVAVSGELRLRIDPAALPAPMRLPALLEPGWRIKVEAALWQSIR